jgi:predicted nucleic acid-binding protein
MAVDLAALRRRYKPERAIQAFRPQREMGLPSPAPHQILLDTTVYIHEAAGRLSGEVSQFLEQALRFNSAIAMAEIISGLGKLHPHARHYEAAWAYYNGLFRKLPERRILTPDAGILTQAGLIAGIVARTQGHRKDHTHMLINDAAIYLTGARYGLPVLTANGADFDLIQQAAGHGDFIVYAPV